MKEIHFIGAINGEYWPFEWEPKKLPCQYEGMERLVHHDGTKSTKLPNGEIVTFYEDGSIHREHQLEDKPRYSPPSET